MNVQKYVPSHTAKLNGAGQIGLGYGTQHEVDILQTINATNALVENDQNCFSSPGFVHVALHPLCYPISFQVASLQCDGA